MKLSGCVSVPTIDDAKMFKEVEVRIDTKEILLPNRKSSREKLQCHRLFLIKLQAYNFIKKRLQHLGVGLDGITTIIMSILADVFKKGIF